MEDGCLILKWIQSFGWSHPVQAKKLFQTKKQLQFWKWSRLIKQKSWRKNSFLRSFFWQIPWIQVKSSLFSTFRSSDLQPPAAWTPSPTWPATWQAWANWRQARKAAKLSPPSHRKLLLLPELGAPSDLEESGNFQQTHHPTTYPAWYFQMGNPDGFIHQSSKQAINQSNWI